MSIGRRTRRVLAGAVLVPVVLSAALAFAWKTVYRPTLDAVPTEPVDAMIVLGPLETWRVPWAEELMRQGVARNLVLSTPNMPWDALYCDEEHPWPAYCFPPDPSTTRGEALGLRELAREHGWTSFVVLTVDFHADRSRFIFERCLRQPVTVLGRYYPDYGRVRPFQLVYQTAGYAKELGLGRCPE